MGVIKKRKYVLYANQNRPVVWLSQTVLLQPAFRRLLLHQRLLYRLAPVPVDLENIWFRARGDSLFLGSRRCFYTAVSFVTTRHG